MIENLHRKLDEMENFDFLDFVLMPIAFLTEYRLITWPLLVAACLWLFYRHFSRSRTSEKFAVVVWRVLVGVAAMAVLCVVVLAILSPKGPDYYRVAIGAIAAIPLVLPALLCFLIRPRAQNVVRR